MTLKLLQVSLYNLSLLQSNLAKSKSSVPEVFVRIIIISNYREVDIKYINPKNDCYQFFFLSNISFEVLSFLFLTQNIPIEPYVLVTKTSFVSFGDENVWDTCFRRSSAKLTSAGHLKDVLKTKCKRV